MILIIIQYEKIVFDNLVIALIKKCSY